MPRPDKHFIRSQVFYIGFYKDSDTMTFQREVTSLIRSELNVITERCLDLHDPGAGVHSIQKLELSLGQIPHDRLGQWLPRRYEEELTQALRRSLGKRSASNVVQVQQSETLSIPLIVHFLRKGYMPWNYDAGRWPSFDHLFHQTLLANSQAVLEALQSIMKSDKVKLRLIRNLEYGSINALVRQIEPTEAQLIIHYHSDWCAIQKTKPVFKGSEQEIARHLWLFIFKYLYDERGSYFNTRSFLISTLRQTALQFNLPFAAIIGLLKVSYEQMSQLSTGSTFNNLIADIIQEFNLDEKPVLPAGQTQLASGQEELSGANFDFARFARGKEPLNTMSGVNPNGYDTIFNNLLDQNLEALLSVLRRLGNDEQAIFRLIEPLPEKTIHKIIYVLEPVHAEGVIEYHTELVAQQEQQTYIKSPIHNFPRVIWSMILVILVDSHGSFFNQKAFAGSLIKRIANRFNMAYGQLLSQLYHGLKSSPSLQPTTSRLLQIVSELYQETFGKTKKQSKQKKPKMVLVDPDLVLDSIISGRLHIRLLRTENYPRDLKSFLSEYIRQNRVSFKQILVKGSKIKDFLTQLIALLGADLLPLLNSVISVKPVWLALFNAVDWLQTSGAATQVHFKSAYKALILQGLLSNGLIESRSFENLVLSVAKAQEQRMTEFLTFCLKAAKAGKSKTFERLLQNMMLQYPEPDTFMPSEFSELPVANEKKSLTDQKDQLLRIVINGLQGVADVHELSKMGFTSLDEVVQYMLKYNPLVLKKGLKQYLPKRPAYLGIGRDISYTAFYQLLEVLLVGHGSQLSLFLSRLSEPGSQSTHLLRLSSGSHALVLRLYLLGTFSAHTFLESFLKLIYKAGAPATEQILSLLLSEHNGTTQTKGDEQIKALTRKNSLSYADFNFRQWGDTTETRARLMELYFNNNPKSKADAIPYWSSAPAETVEVFIENAGLVLLQPFYPQLFRQLGLIDERGTFDIKMREKATMILQYVLMDYPSLAEEHLVFNKLLAGLEIDHVFNTEPLPEKEQKAIRKTIHGMISAAISHWPAIGKSSVAGFRGNWLYRKGKLQLGEESWELHVERKPYDLLIDQLPFAISPVNYSWMKKPLIVYWQ